MAAQVVDELIVTLSLDAEQYQTAERKVERETDRTYRKQTDRVRRTDRAARDQQRGLKTLGAGLRSVALGATAAVAAVAAVGGTVTGILGGFVNFQTNLSRQAVSTGLSNRSMQAWSATARRMGADAEAGSAAIAALAKEQKQFNVTGNGPTMQALATFGVNVNPGRKIEDILADAQGMYRNAAPGQRMQIEAGLAARGVSDDLILMIKSEIDARDTFAKSYAQSQDENVAANARVRDALESMKATALSAAATLLEVLTPAVKWGAEKLGTFATNLTKFANDLTDAGISVDGFQKALDDNYPKLGHLFEGFGILADLVGDVVQGFKNLGRWFGGAGQRVQDVLNRSRAPWGHKPLVNDIDDRLRGMLGIDSQGLNAQGLNPGQAAALGLSNWWGRVTSRDAPAPAPAQLRNLEHNYGADASQVRNLEHNYGGGNPASAQSIMQTLTSEYGLSVPQAAAVVANWERESSLNPAAFNPAGGGRGARGLAQWRGPRIAAFERKYGVSPDQASVEEQIHFAMTDPYERSLMERSFASGGSAQALGVGYSKLYEAHGNVAEDMRRGQRAAQLASGYGSGAGGPQITVQNMTVQANNPTEFAQGMQRIDSTQPYNTVVR